MRRLQINSIVLVLSVVATSSALMTFYMSSQPTVYTASGDYFIPTRFGENQMSTLDASRIAVNYSSTLGRDQQLLDHLAKKVGVSRDAISSTLRIDPSLDASAFRVTWENGDPQRVVMFFSAFAQAVASDQSIAKSVIPGSVLPLSQPATAQAKSGLSKQPALLGAIIGLFLSLLVIFVYERKYPRISNAAELQMALGIPVFDVDRIDTADIAAYLDDKASRDEIQDIAFVSMDTELGLLRSIASQGVVPSVKAMQHIPLPSTSDHSNILVSLLGVNACVLVAPRGLRLDRLVTVISGVECSNVTMLAGLFSTSRR